MHLPFSILGVRFLNIFPLLLFHVYHGVEVDILEDERFEGMFSARLSSRNSSPNFVFSKDSFLLCNWILSSDVLTKDCCCFSRRSGFTRIVEATVSRCTFEDSSSFLRCSNLVSLTRDVPR